jgi:hypothetical protein
LNGKLTVWRSTEVLLTYFCAEAVVNLETVSCLVLAGQGVHNDKLLPVIDGVSQGTRAPETQTDSLKTVVIDCIVGQTDTKILWVFEWIVGKRGILASLPPAADDARIPSAALARLDQTLA